jgi:acetyltransferase-like isoleucine patch superfamily enzyme
MPEPATLSVVLTNFNHAKFLRRALPALAAQTRPPDEWILIDDASTDDSRSILAEFARTQTHATVIHHEKNLGVVASLNEGLRGARGDYVYFAAADDVTLPHLFARLMDALNAHPGAGGAWADFFIFSDDCPAIFRHHVCPATTTTFLSSEGLAQLLLSGARLNYPPSGVITHRSTLLQIGAFDARAGWAADWWFNLQVGLRRGVCFVPEALAGFRHHAESFSGGGTKNFPDAEELWKLATQAAPPRTPEELWYCVMAALPLHARRKMWREIWRRPTCWLKGMGQYWKIEGWPAARPWLWPVMQTLLRIFPTSCLPGALRFFGATMSENIRIARGVTIDRPWRLRLDESVVLEAGVKICAHWSVHIGAEAIVGKNCVLDSSALAKDHAGTDAIIIGPRARVGDSTRIYSGAVIAEGAVIAAHSELRVDNAPEPARLFLGKILQTVNFAAK